MNTLRHYGSPAFDPSRWDPVQDTTNYNNKPLGGLWVSPVDTQRGWKDWCLAEGFYTDSLSVWFDITLSPDARVLRIDTEADLGKLHWAHGSRVEVVPLFRPLLPDWDAVWLTEQGQEDTRWCADGKSLYGWDCESVLILNPDVINEQNHHHHPPIQT